MITSPDFKELLSLFKKYEVKFLIVGGYAVMRYTEPRFTKDIDLLIATDQKNASKVYNALVEFGAPLSGLTAKDFMTEGYIYQMGRPPFRVDILMSIPGVSFALAWKNRDTFVLDRIELSFISKRDLICSKKACGRPQDLLDISNLEKQQE